MKTSKQLFARLIAAVLVLMMVVAAAIPAMANPTKPNEPPYTITINNNEGLPGMVEGQFSAYQIFQGKAFKEGTVTDQGGNTFNKYSLADIEWGVSVILSKEISAEPGGAPTIKSLIAELKAADSLKVNGENPFAGLDDQATAAQVAAVLEKNTSNSFLQALSAFFVGSGVGEDDSWLQEKAESGNYTYPVTSTLNKGADEDKASDDSSTITVNEAGYYLIVEDKEPTDDDGAYGVQSEYILAVLGDQNINIKADVPTVDKAIANHGEGGNSEGDSVGLGDTVTFTLTGELPNNFADYEWYYYIFTDTLSKGLTFVSGSLKIYIVNGTDKKEVTLDSVTSANWVEATESVNAHAAEGQFPTYVAPVDESTGVTNIKIDMGDLKLGYGAYNITSDSQIVVEYSATLNQNAVIGDEGNPNTVKLDYSNNPNRQGDMGNTPDVTVRVYTFNLELKKIGDDTQTALQGAEFYLSKTVDGDTYYYCTGNDTYEWIKADGTGRPGTAVRLVTNANGTFDETVTGLDAGVEYTLTEVVAPNGYNTIKPFTFSFDVTINDSGELSNIVTKTTFTPDQGITWQLSKATPAAPDFTASLSFTVVDPKAPFLPFTGGTGTVIFYVLGGLMIAGVAFYIALSGKKSKKNN